ncbi:MAG: ParB N-terminal domain-containing protein [Rhodospirillaceae bacterium]|nr:chromosome partitioning protein ParB [Rhodospirillaceae bacterium]MBT5384043.1 ParB N-terminal domain-containing protein [Kordiimonadaceae bacterium]MDG1274670.1 ParB N-terminal domain-containing protein [Alphaproteobacteria bacterium]MBT4355325.1 ParB N-terminal domain-containing protein [Rhodospirillaceae bacterium]MBT5912591.1 ParB N-terminal domain-containing protein [Rhodospirillaceae bacterium]|tara:strand:- start:311 stop:556 length:246 start_codon:yes stop_codon:yes gene_type:complete
MQEKPLTISDIYVPIKRRSTLNQETVDSLAEAILEEGQKVPIQVRQDGARLVLIEGLHRLEACRALGESSIMGILVRARLH